MSINRPGSAHLRRVGLLARAGEILVGRWSAKSRSRGSFAARPSDVGTRTSGRSSGARGFVISDATVGRIIAHLIAHGSLSSHRTRRG
jgi:hypothetical protein